MPERAPLVTVLTPTFNRGLLLEDAYHGLLSQTARDFEWLVVDDGSTDDTLERLRRWRVTAPFEVRWLHQPNSGKHVALNRGVRDARGEYIAVLDSDDCYLPAALEILLRHFDSIPAERRAEFANVEARSATPSGQLVGRPLPAAIVDSDNFSIQELEPRLGDTAGMYRAEVLRAHPFPEDLGRFVPEALVWNRIARRYRTRFVSDVIEVKRYQPDGLTARPPAARIREALAYRAFHRELVTMPQGMRVSTRLRGYANYVRCCRHLRVGLLAEMRDAPSRLWWFVARPAGVAAWAWDVLRARRSGGAGAASDPTRGPTSQDLATPVR